MNITSWLSDFWLWPRRPDGEVMDVSAKIYPVFGPLGTAVVVLGLLLVVFFGYRRAGGDLTRRRSILEAIIPASYSMGNYG